MLANERNSGSQMSKISSDAARILGEDFLETVDASSRYALLSGVVAAGWVQQENATLLSDFLETYHGDRARFPSVGSYEAAVNGRGVPDFDIVATGVERIAAIMRRGVCFAWDALHAAGNLSWAPPLLARISSAPILMDPDVYAGYVTFISERFRQDLGIEEKADPPGIQVVLSSLDCIEPLPGR